MKKVFHVIRKAFITFAGYFATVVVTLLFSQAIWPDGLEQHSQFLFWPASGVALLFALHYGPKYTPALLLAVVPAIVFAGEPPMRAMMGALGNVLECWAAWAVFVRLFRFEGRMDSTRAVLGLMTSTMVGGAVASISYPLFISLGAGFDAASWDSTLIRYAFGNSCGSMVVVAAFYSLKNRTRSALQHPSEAVIWFLLTCVLSGFVFNAIFSEKVNYAFLLFPVVLYAAVRFGSHGCVAALTLVLTGVGFSLIRFGPEMEVASVIPVIQFLQGFTWVLTVTGLYIAALVGERRIAQQRVLEEKNRFLKASLHSERAKLEALRYQINPHFLLNALNAVGATVPAEHENTREMLTSTAEYLRTILDHPPTDVHALGRELESVKQYVAIEQHRFGSSLSFTIDAEPEAEEVPVPVWILQPLLENALRHGMATHKGLLHLSVKARTSNGSLRVEVENDGDWNKKNQGTGIGLENIRSRLNLLYSDQASLQILPSNGKVCVVLEVPERLLECEHEDIDIG